jgi:uncharacterized protein YdhG (YjbR/CyaY superfamily)
MRSEAKTPQDYMDSLPEDRKEALELLRKSISENLPEGFEEQMGYGMLGYVVPHSIYPAGYHCDPKLPLPFMGFASQKNFISFYHMGIYADKELMDWFLAEFPKYSDRKPDMGKSCIRFKKPAHIPHELLGRLAAKMSVKDWVSLYEKQFKK